MIFDKFSEIRKNLMNRGATYYALGKDVFEYGRDLIKEKMEERQSFGTGSPKEDSTSTGKKRKNLKKNFSVPDPHDPSIEAKIQSLESHGDEGNQHVASGYHGAGKAGNKTNANKLQRNYDNHQGN